MHTEKKLYIELNINTANEIRNSSSELTGHFVLNIFNFKTTFYIESFNGKIKFAALSFGTM